MKKESIIRLILFIIGIIAGYIIGLIIATVIINNHTKDVKIKVKAPIISDTIYYIQPTKSDTISLMADAFSYVESRHNDNVVSSDGKYVGCLQISKICVREANRILKDSVFTYDDRYDKIMSYAIFEVLQLHYNPSLDIDKAIDIWNKNCHILYRNEVKEQYFNNLKEL